MISVRVINNFRRAQNFLHNASEETLDIIGGFVVGQAKLRCPVKTGHLKGSLKYRVRRRFRFFGAKLLQIYTNVEYAIFVHEGTRKMRPRRFIKDAITENMAQIRLLAENRFRRER
jgi:HK97 gp10 family phage protein